MEDKGDTKHHWCTELFPPTYTAEEILHKDDVEHTNPRITQDFYSKIYSQVILDEVLAKQSKLSKGVKCTTILPGNSACSIEKASCEVIDNVDHVWSKDDIHVFRKSYGLLKERAVKLLCILESINLKVTDLKIQNKELKKKLKEKQKLLSGVTKENTILQGYVKGHNKISSDLESKLQFYEDCNNNLKEVIHKKDKDLLEIRLLYQTEQIINQNNVLSIDELKEYQRINLIEMEESLRIDYSGQINSLKTEIENLVVSKMEKHEECDKFKSNFLTLQKHFLDGAIISSQVDNNVLHEMEFLGITDMSNLDTFIAVDQLP